MPRRVLDVGLREGSMANGKSRGSSRSHLILAAAITGGNRGVTARVPAGAFATRGASASRGSGGQAWPFSTRGADPLPLITAWGS
jgi:hypothetical protein